MSLTIILAFILGICCGLVTMLMFYRDKIAKLSNDLEKIKEAHLKTIDSALKLKTEIDKHINNKQKGSNV